MHKEQIYSLIRSAFEELKKEESDICIPEETMLPEKKLFEYGLEPYSLGDLERDLEKRFGGRALNFESFMVPETFYDVTMGSLVEYLAGRLGPASTNPIVVYVDDEEENLFIFKRKFGKVLNLKVFADPREALTFIVGTDDVALVITDEVMPGLTGNQLCDEVKKAKPFMKFILITGNPENDNQLMYKSLRHSRFYEFIQKPVDFDGKFNEYLSLIKNLTEDK